MDMDAPLSSQDELRLPNADTLGQGAFQYRADRYWGRLNPDVHPVRDCHGIAEDSLGRIVVLTNDTRNNLIAYDKAGSLCMAWETRFPGAHGLLVATWDGAERYWITDHDRQVVAACAADGTELFTIGPDAVSAHYVNGRKYLPTQAAVVPDGDIFVADGYGAGLIHHFDPLGRLVGSFGGEGPGPEHLKQPHAICLDTRGGTPLLLICDRGNEQLKWFSMSGELSRCVPLPGAMPSNVSFFKGVHEGCMAVACLSGMILVLDAADRVVSVVGGPPPRYVGERLQKLRSFNYVFNHPHDVHADQQGALYVAQWWSNRTYPIKLEPQPTEDAQ